MIKVLFVCHGNICRSPMSEFIMREMVRQRGLSDLIGVDSAATSREEIGNDMYPPAKRKLIEEGIPFERRHARQITRADYDRYDLIICMERYNLRNISRIIPDDPEGKIHLLLDYSDSPRDISDPWYTGDFDRAYADIVEGCEGLLEHILSS
ncbi:MAG: low molecular weight phosphotyrosine protein phosphatase [Lachnospiraceae bacterium]|nr:low molecular weight phosphotyrosine protein phosphatase [Lachnospiraceae bacterium]